MPDPTPEGRVCVLSAWRHEGLVLRFSVFVPGVAGTKLFELDPIPLNESAAKVASALHDVARKIGRAADELAHNPHTSQEVSE